MRLKEYGQSLAYDVAFWLQGLSNPTYPIQELGKLSLEVSEKLRALAIVTLLVKGDVDFFYHNLIRSGRSRETYLRRLKNANLSRDHHQASGRYEPLLDAIAANELVLARSIISLSPADLQRGHEYEDDYCYAQVLGRLLSGHTGKTQVRPLLERFENYLAGEPNARFDLSRALLEKNQSAFDESFDALLVERDVWIEERKEEGQLEEPAVVAQRQVFVEGLAILRLAESVGLTTQEEYRYCPSLARMPMQVPFPRE